MIDYKRKQKQPMHFLLNFKEIELASECVFTLHCRVMPKKYLITVASAGSIDCITKLVKTNEVPAIREAIPADRWASAKEGTFDLGVTSVFQNQ